MTSVCGRAGATAHRWGSGGLHLQREEGQWGNKASKSLRAQVCHMSTPLSGDKRARETLLLAERGESGRGSREIQGEASGTVVPRTAWLGARRSAPRGHGLCYSPSSCLFKPRLYKIISPLTALALPATLGICHHRDQRPRSSGEQIVSRKTTCLSGTDGALEAPTQGSFPYVLSQGSVCCAQSWWRRQASCPSPQNGPEQKSCTDGAHTGQGTVTGNVTVANTSRQR